jgi:hypothetical protein
MTDRSACPFASLQVARGYVVLAIDPVGQGERDQYFPASDPSGFFQEPTNQHEVSG